MSEITKMKNEGPLLLTVKEVGDLLRVQRPKVYELIKEGAIEGFKVGADWRVRRDSVELLVGQIPEEFFTREKDGDEDSDAAGTQNLGGPAVLRG